MSELVMGIGVPHNPTAPKRSAPESALARFKLDNEERQALLAGDVASLFRKGGHPFLLQHLAQHRLFGLNRDVYRERIVSLNGQRSSGSSAPGPVQHVPPAVVVRNRR